MKYVRIMFAVVLTAALVCPSFAASPKAKPYDGCVPICKGQKPFLEAVEDGLALLLDIPFALLSPICSQIVTPVLDKIDPIEDRSYPRRGSRR
ncbi:MAG: hypothetical protein V2B18_07420 [Pseudomonadota bacterium]